jgi:arginyl-tRNA synthetase
LKDIISNLLLQAAKTLIADTSKLSIILERPKSAEHGDFASNLAMMLAKPLRQNPRTIAEQLIKALPPSKYIEKVDIAGAGFINFHLATSTKQLVVGQVLKEGEKFGHNETSKGKKVQVEFVSANPTGPLHIGHGRGAAVGDCLSRLLAANGWDVTREFYYNDAGAQIDNLTQSVLARAQGLATDDPSYPQNGYHGEYIADIAKAYLAKETIVADDVKVTASGNLTETESIRNFSVAYLRHEQDLDLHAFQIKFDVFSLESTLYRRYCQEQGVNILCESHYQMGIMKD